MDTQEQKRINTPPALSVSEISTALKSTVEERFSLVKVQGEISGFKRATSGHLYMDLKDDNAVINAVCWRGVAGKIDIDLHDGMEVIITGKITTYAPRSNYQLIISKVEIAGQGALLQRLEILKKALAQEGLFDQNRKKALPRLPENIAIVTSPTGAVLHDIMHRINDRCPRNVFVYPCRVQGEGSANEIVKALEFLDNPNNGIVRPDVIIVARGGGSIEDLWSFNEEGVVRCVAKCTVPIVSAIGHETDTTLIDYVSDFRAPTPTAAAEKVVPVMHEVLAYLDAQKNTLHTIIENSMHRHTLQLQLLEKQLPDVDTLINSKHQRIDDYVERLVHVGSVMVHTFTHKYEQTVSRLRDVNDYIAYKETHFTTAVKEFEHLAYHDSRKREHTLELVSGLLESFSFKKVLHRGFALVRDSDGAVIQNIATAKDKKHVTITVSDGDIDATIL